MQLFWVQRDDGAWMLSSDAARKAWETRHARGEGKKDAAPKKPGQLSEAEKIANYEKMHGTKKAQEKLSNAVVEKAAGDPRQHAAIAATVAIKKGKSSTLEFKTATDANVARGRVLLALTDAGFGVYHKDKGDEVIGLKNRDGKKITVAKLPDSRILKIIVHK